MAESMRHGRPEAPRFDRPLPEEAISYYIQHGTMAERALALHLRAERMETQEMVERLSVLDAEREQSEEDTATLRWGDLVAMARELRALRASVARLGALKPQIEMVRAWRRREGWLNAPMSSRATDVLGVVLEMLEPWRTEGG